MKQCNQCQTTLDDIATVCTVCGSQDLTVLANDPQTPEQPMPGYQPPYQTYNPNYNPSVMPAEENGNGNVLAGVVGAFLFSIIGGILYFIIYQMDIIAGICGLVMFVLANFGYRLFAQTKNKACIPALIASIASMIVMIFIAEYICIAYIIYELFSEFGMSFFEAARYTPNFLIEYELVSDVIGELVFAYIFGFVASISNIIEIVKARKNQQQNPYIVQ